MENNGHIRLGCWNSRGMSAAVPYLRKLLVEHDFLCLSEHWLHENRLDFFNEISDDVNYHARSSKHASAESYGSNRGQGGVCIFWKKDLKGVTPMVHLKHDRFCGVRVQNLNGAIFNIYSIYLPASGSSEDFATCLDELGALIENSEMGSMNVICGDFNADPGKLGGQRAYKNASARGMILMDFIHRYSFNLINLGTTADGPVDTHFGPTGQSCIDFIALPEGLSEHLQTCVVFEDDAINTSDHNPVSAVIDFGSMPRICRSYEASKKVKWGKVDSETMAARYTRLVEVECEGLLLDLERLESSAETIDNIFERLIVILKRNERNLPCSRFNKKVKPYWCPELTQLKREKVNAYRLWCASGRNKDEGNLLWHRTKQCKKRFNKRLRQLAKTYDDERIRDAVRCAEIDKTVFWKMLRRTRDGHTVKVPSVKDEGGQVKHEVNEILEVWRRHFSKLATPKDDLTYDNAHYVNVSAQVRNWLESDDDDDFSRDFFTKDEVCKGVCKLNGGKTPGHDGVTKENIYFAGETCIEVLVRLYNMMLECEYVPQNFRVGIQVPLYKGKNTCTLNVNNYRGITLLSTFSKLFEVLLWARIKPWWEENRIISELQGACRGGISCIHTAFLLQETISQQLELHNKVFVCYLDVSKAFDGVWTDGLFYNLRDLGIHGKTWRMLYKSYVNFVCKVRICDQVSAPYGMFCGIHQGGYLSLLKYVAFINSLLVQLADSGICCSFQGSNVSPLGYADDLASACISKFRVDRTLELVYRHSRIWRYNFNAEKCAILVFGESHNDARRNSQYREYRLGNEKVLEKPVYDHLGLKSCTQDQTIRVIEKVKKGRKVFNMAAGLGLKPGGLTVKTSSLLVWSMIVPIILYASELWVLKDSDVVILDTFQRYMGRRVQRFPPRSPNETSCVGLGWLRLELFIYVKKLLFVRTVSILDDDNIYKCFFCKRARQFDMNRNVGFDNVYNSPVFDILKVAYLFDVYEDVMRMLTGVIVYSKKSWKDIIWAKAWNLENDDWVHRTMFFRSTEYIRSLSNEVQYLRWWLISDQRPDLMRTCETMAKLVCKTSLLKADDYRLKRELPGAKVCPACDLYALEDVTHLIMSCPSMQLLRTEMFAELRTIENQYGYSILDQNDVLMFLLGKLCNAVPDELNYDFHITSASFISRMYMLVLERRKGIG